jgi:Ca2+/H+ antiporter
LGKLRHRHEEYVFPLLTILSSSHNPFYRWFGVVLLPLVSFSADGLVAIGRYIKHRLGRHAPPTTMAKAQAIDLSVQFLLFWLPFLVLLGWWTDKPLSLLFGESAPCQCFCFCFFSFFHLCGPTWEMDGSVRIVSTLAWRSHSFTLSPFIRHFVPPFYVAPSNLHLQSRHI